MPKTLGRKGAKSRQVGFLQVLPGTVAMFVHFVFLMYGISCQEGPPVSEVYLQCQRKSETNGGVVKDT